MSRIRHEAHVIDCRGVPIPYAEISITKAGTSGPPIASTIADHNGRYTVMLYTDRLYRFVIRDAWRQVLAIHDNVQINRAKKQPRPKR